MRKLVKYEDWSFWNQLCCHALIGGLILTISLTVEILYFQQTSVFLKDPDIKKVAVKELFAAYELIFLFLSAIIFVILKSTFFISIVIGSVLRVKNQILLVSIHMLLYSIFACSFINNMDNIPIYTKIILVFALAIPEIISQHTINEESWI